MSDRLNEWHFEGFFYFVCYLTDVLKLHLDQYYGHKNAVPVPKNVQKYAIIIVLGKLTQIYMYPLMTLKNKCNHSAHRWQEEVYDSIYWRLKIHL